MIETDLRHRLAARWEDVLGRIRAQPGFERFLLPPRIAELAPAATEGPVAINVSQHGCAALILPEEGTVQAVRLRELTVASLQARVGPFQDALEIVHTGGMAARLDAHATIRETRFRALPAWVMALSSASRAWSGCSSSSASASA